MAVSPRSAYSLRPGRVSPSGTGRPGSDSFIPDCEVVSRFACPSVARPAARLSVSQLRALARRQAPGSRARSRLHLPQAFRARRRFAPALDSQHQPARCRAAWGQAFGVGLWTSQSPTQRPGRRPRRVVRLSGRRSVVRNSGPPFRPAHPFDREGFVPPVLGGYGTRRSHQQVGTNGLPGGWAVEPILPSLHLLARLRPRAHWGVPYLGTSNDDHSHVWGSRYGPLNHTIHSGVLVR